MRITNKEKLATFDAIKAERDKLQLVLHDLTNPQTKFPFFPIATIDVNRELDTRYAGIYQVSVSMRGNPIYQVRLGGMVEYWTDTEIFDHREDQGIIWRVLRLAVNRHRIAQRRGEMWEAAWVAACKKNGLDANGEPETGAQAEGSQKS